MIHQQICLLFGVLLALVIQHNFVRMLQMISLEQYRRVIGLYASRTGPTGGFNKRHVHVSFRFRLRLRLHLKLITVSLCLFACTELLLLRSGDVETNPGPAYCAVSECHSRSYLHRS